MSSGGVTRTHTAFPLLVSMEAIISASNADTGSMAYLLRAVHANVLKKQVKYPSTASAIYETKRVNG